MRVDKYLLGKLIDFASPMNYQCGRKHFSSLVWELL